jgi:hypothetical protein
MTEPVTFSCGSLCNTVAQVSEPDGLRNENFAARWGARGTETTITVRNQDALPGVEGGWKPETPPSAVLCFEISRVYHQASPPLVKKITGRTSARCKCDESELCG